MALPKAIQAQIEAADRLQNELSGEETGQPETGTETPPADPPIEQPVSRAEPVVQAQPQVPEETWERKYATLKGMYDAEVPRLYQQMREITTQVQSLVAENAQLKVQPQRVPEPVRQTPLITEKDTEAFGPDLLDVMGRMVEEKTIGIRTELATVKAENEQLKGRLGNVSERQVVSNKDLFEIGLTSRVPDWRTLNTDQGFLAWLQEVDEVYGIPRQVSLTSAYERFDADRVGAIFNAYKKQLAPAPNTPPKPTNAQELQRQIAPTRTRNAPTPVDTSAKPIWTQNQITKFYEDWRRGLVSNEDAARTEIEIHAAINEGRIRP